MDPEQGSTRLTPRRPLYELLRIHFANSRVLIILNSRQNFRVAKVAESPRRSDKFQLRGSPITSIHRFFLFFSSTSNPTGPLPLPFQQEESSKHRSQPEALYGRAFFLFFFFFYDRPGSFRKRALTVEPRGGCKVSDAFPRDNFDIMKYRRGSSIKLD